MDHVIQNDECIDLNIAAGRLKDNYQTEWAESVKAKPKLRIYEKHKKKIEPERYLTSNLPKYNRSLIAQLRFGILPLRIETGRYVNEQIGERLCTLCNMQEVEDEYHFLLHCNKYTAERELLLQDLHINRTEFSHLENIDQSTTIMNNIHIFGNYLGQIFNIRRKTMYHS